MPEEGSGEGVDGFEMGFGGLTGSFDGGTAIAQHHNNLGLIGDCSIVSGRDKGEGAIALSISLTPLSVAFWLEWSFGVKWRSHHKTKRRPKRQLDKGVKFIILLKTSYKGRHSLQLLLPDYEAHA